MKLSVTSLRVILTSFVISSLCCFGYAGHLKANWNITDALSAAYLGTFNVHRSKDNGFLSQYGATDLTHTY